MVLLIRAHWCCENRPARLRRAWTDPAHGTGVGRRAGNRESTRERVARSILEHGPSTAVALAERLGLTPAAIRRHLDVLVERGHLVGREQRTYGARGRGRPAKVFALTDAGRNGSTPPRRPRGAGAGVPGRSGRGRGDREVRRQPGRGHGNSLRPAPRRRAGGGQRGPGARRRPDQRRVRRLHQALGGRGTALPVEALGPDLVVAGRPETMGELRFAVRCEGARTVADLLDRRTRIGLVPADRERAVPGGRAGAGLRSRNTSHWAGTQFR